MRMLIILLCLGFASTLPAQVAEICDNQVDDDGDGLVDCDDPECQPGEFADSGQLLGNSGSYDLSLGDLDGDGDLDAFIANGPDPAGEPNRIWINQGGAQGGSPGVFLDSGQALGNSYGINVALGDLDGDGDLHAFVTNYPDQPNRIWINQGGATMPPRALPASSPFVITTMVFVLTTLPPPPATSSSSSSETISRSLSSCFLSSVISTSLLEFCSYRYEITSPVRTSSGFGFLRVYA